MTSLVVHFCSAPLVCFVDALDTRASNLLVLAAGGEHQARFNSIWEGAGRWPCVDRESLSRQRFGNPGLQPRDTVAQIGHLDRLVVNLMKSRPMK